MNLRARLNKNKNGSRMVQEDNDVICRYIIKRRYGIRVAIGSTYWKPGSKRHGRRSCVNTTKHRPAKSVPVMSRR